MNPGGEEAEVFSDAEDLGPAREDEEEGGDEEEEEDEEEDGRIFNAWMQQYRGKDRQEKTEEEEKEDGEPEEGRSESRSSVGLPVGKRTDRRASLPCPATLSSMQLSRLHSSTRAPVSAKVLLRRTSSRRLLPSSLQEVADPTLERRSSIIPTIPEVIVCEKRGPFRRRNVMSLSDADSICLICHNDLNRGSGGKTELQCTHTFHKECIEEWLWRKQSCPTCHVQVVVTQPAYWSSTTSPLEPPARQGDIVGFP